MEREMQQNARAQKCRHQDLDEKKRLLWGAFQQCIDDGLVLDAEALAQLAAFSDDDDDTALRGSSPSDS